MSATQPQGASLPAPPTPASTQEVGITVSGELHASVVDVVSTAATTPAGADTFLKNLHNLLDLAGPPSGHEILSSSKVGFVFGDTNSSGRGLPPFLMTIDTNDTRVVSVSIRSDGPPPRPNHPRLDPLLWKVTLSLGASNAIFKQRQRVAPPPAAANPMDPAVEYTIKDKWDFNLTDLRCDAGAVTPTSGTPDKPLSPTDYQLALMLLRGVSGNHLPPLQQQLCLSVLDGIRSGSGGEPSFYNEGALEEIAKRMLCPLWLPTDDPRRARVPGVMFSGPPGTGKSHVSLAIARQSGFRVIFFGVPVTLLDKYIGETEKAIEKLFNEARKTPELPCIIVFEEVDSIAGKRTEQTQSHELRWLNLLLDMLAGPQGSNVTLLCTTNRPGSLDEAFVRPGRVGVNIYFGNIDASSRHKLCISALRGKGFDSLADEMQGDTALQDTFSDRSRNCSGATIRAGVDAFAQHLAFTRSADTNPDVDAALIEQLLQCVAKANKSGASVAYSPPSQSNSSPSAALTPPSVLDDIRQVLDCAGDRTLEGMVTGRVLFDAFSHRVVAPTREGACRPAFSHAEFPFFGLTGCVEAEFSRELSATHSTVIDSSMQRDLETPMELVSRFRQAGEHGGLVVVANVDDVVGPTTDRTINSGVSSATESHHTQQSMSTTRRILYPRALEALITIANHCSFLHSTTEFCVVVFVTSNQDIRDRICASWNMERAPKFDELQRSKKVNVSERTTWSTEVYAAPMGSVRLHHPIARNQSTLTLFRPRMRVATTTVVVGVTLDTTDVATLSAWDTSQTSWGFIVGQETITITAPLQAAASEAVSPPPPVRNLINNNSGSLMGILLRRVQGEPVPMTEVVLLQKTDDSALVELCKITLPPSVSLNAMALAFCTVGAGTSVELEDEFLVPGSMKFTNPPTNFFGFDTPVCEIPQSMLLGGCNGGVTLKRLSTPNPNRNGEKFWSTRGASTAIDATNPRYCLVLEVMECYDGNIWVGYTTNPTSTLWVGSDRGFGFDIGSCVTYFAGAACGGKPNGAPAANNQKITKGRRFALVLDLNRRRLDLFLTTAGGTWQHASLIAQGSKIPTDKTFYPAVSLYHVGDKIRLKGFSEIPPEFQIVERAFMRYPCRRFNTYNVEHNPGGSVTVTGVGSVPVPLVCGLPVDERNPFHCTVGEVLNSQKNTMRFGYVTDPEVTTAIGCQQGFGYDVPTWTVYFAGTACGGRVPGAPDANDKTPLEGRRFALVLDLGRRRLDLFLTTVDGTWQHASLIAQGSKIPTDKTFYPAVSLLANDKMRLEGYDILPAELRGVAVNL